MEQFMKALTTLFLTAMLAAFTLSTALAETDSSSGMMESMDKDSGMDMQKMMNDPKMKERMQKHVDMMQAMLDSEGLSKKEMQKMMDDPEMQSMMKSMMKKHKKCSKMMKGGMEGESSMGSDGSHEEHHAD